MEQHYLEVATRLLLAILAGGIIGVERAHHGRPAGLRTHTLVCMSSCLLMLLAAFQWDFVDPKYMETIRVDPTRMGQGIMTGIGFLGAGVIMKEKFTIRGLTTAGSIWVTASIGIIIGMGFYFAAFFATVATVVVLSMFRWLEKILPSLYYAKVMMSFKASEVIDKETILNIVNECGVFSFSPSFVLDDEGRFFRYEMTVRTKDINNFHQLSETLRVMEAIREYSVIPTGD